MTLADNFIVEKDGKKYVYRSTSVYDPQTKRKRTVSEYIGKIDPVTGELIEKKSRNRPESTPQGGIIVKNYGACHAFVSIAESCGLRDDLHTAFGQGGDYILASAISLILTGGPMYYIEPEMETNMARELLGFDNSVTPENIFDVISKVCDNPDNVESLFRLRTKRASKVAIFNRVFTPEPDSEFGWIDRGTGISKESNYCIATDLDGIPVFFEPCYDFLLDVLTIRRLTERLIGFGTEDPVAILDQCSGRADNLSSLVSDHVSFVVPAKKKTPVIKQILSQVVKKRSDPRSLRRYNDENFIVFDSEVAVVPRKTSKKPDYPDDDDETAELELIEAGDARFKQIPLDDRMVSWACQEIGGNTEEGREAMNQRLSEIEARLMDMDPYDAVESLRDVAGELSRFFDASVVEGELLLKIRQKAVTAALNREGIFVILSYGVKNWNVVMQCYECRNHYEQSLKILRGNLSTGTLSGKNPPLINRMLVQFTAMVLWCTAEKRLTESDVELPVSTVMQLLDTVMATGDGTSWHITEITPRSRKMFEALHVPIPKSQVSSLPYNYEPGKFDFSRMNENNDIIRD